jgi:hypothetical protein
MAMAAGRKTALCVASYALLAILSFLPQSLHPQDTVAYVGDPLESVYLVAWNVHQFWSTPSRLFQANVLHPTADALALTDHRLLPSLVVSPIVRLGNPVLATNVAVALACVLAAYAARKLAQALGVAAIGAWTAGALYGFHTYQVSEAARLNLVCHGFIPLALVELVRLLTSGRARHAWAAAGLLLLQGLCSNYLLLYGAFVFAVVIAGALLARPRETARRLPWLAAAGALAGVLFLPIALPYLRSARTQGYARDLPRGIDLAHYVSTAPANVVYGPIGLEVRRQQQGPHFVGFVSLALCAVALSAAVLRRADAPGPLLATRVWIPAAAALALLLVALSLGRELAVFGHTFGPGPYRLLHAYVPGFQLVRIPERLGLIAMLFVALLVGRGLSLVAARSSAVAALLAVLVPLEHLSLVDEATRVPIGRLVPQAYLSVADARAIVDLPVRGEGLVRRETIEMYFSTFHWRPIVQGYTAYPPLLTRVLRRLAAEFPSEASLQALTRVGVDTAIVHHGRDLGVDLLNQLPGATAEDERFRRRLRAADLDLYDRLGPAVAAHRISRVLSFDDARRLFESTADEVYRILPAPAMSAAPFPVGRRLSSPSWRYRTKAGDPLPAADGDLATDWVVPRRLNGDEFFEIAFDRPTRVAGLVIPLRRDSQFPTRFRVAARQPDGAWVEWARFDAPHALQLVDRLLADPRTAAIGFDLQGREASGLSLLVEEGGTSFEGWRIPEVEVWVP